MGDFMSNHTDAAVAPESDNRLNCVRWLLGLAQSD